MPNVRLASTSGQTINLLSLREGCTVIYCYPRTSEPGKPAPTDWDIIPGARGCTPQACSSRDHHAEIAKAGAAVFGLSTQTTAYQREMPVRHGAAPGAKLVFRPQHATLGAAAGNADCISLPGLVAGREFLGASVRYLVKIGETEVAIDAPFQSGRELFDIGRELTVSLSRNSLLWLRD